MCVDPASAGIASAILGGFSTMASFVQQSRAAADQTAAYNQNIVNSLAAARDDQKQLTLRQIQEQESYATQDHVQALEEAEKESQVRLSASEGGVAGLSVDNLIADVHRRSSLNRDALLQNYQWTAQQLQAEQESTTTLAKSRINSMAPAQGPSAFGLVAGLGNDAFQGYNTYARLKTIRMAA